MLGAMASFEFPRAGTPGVAAEILLGTCLHQAISTVADRRTEMMRTRLARGTIALATALSIACGGRGCGSRSTETQSAVLPDGPGSAPVGPPGSSSAVAFAIRQAHAGLDQSLRRDGAAPAGNDLAERLKLAMGGIRDAAARLPKDTFDLQTVVGLAGRAEDKLLAWVQQETVLVPYQGVLRGARGVLMDRVGNSLDRSLLLATLLEMTSTEVRLARTRLTQEQAESLLGRVRATPRRSASMAADATAEPVEAFLAEYSRRFQANAETVRERLKTLRTSEAAMGTEAARRSTAQASLLRKVAGVPAAEPGSDDQGYLEALADHWWVQAKRGNRWVDLDPTGLGTSDKLAEGTVATFRSTAIPEELRHRLRVQVLVECACGQQLTEQTVLDHTIDLADQLFEPIVLQQAPTAAPTTMGAIPATEAGWQQVRDWLVKQDEWMPALSVGSKVIVQSAFTIAGDVRKPGSKAPASPAGGMMDALGGGEEPPAGLLTAEFIRYDLTGPGIDAYTERRTVVDWIGPKVRRETSGKAPSKESVRQRPVDLVHSTEVLPLPAQPSPDFVAHLAAQALLGASGILVDRAVTNGNTPAPRQTDESPGVSFRLLELALARERWNPDRDKTYLREANLLTRHHGIRENQTGPELWSAFDIVFNRIGIEPGTQAGPASEIRSRQGALDTNAEVMLDARYGRATNVSEVMELERVRAWQEQTDAAGRPGIVRVESEPAGADGSGYWLIDQNDGSLLGYTPSGWGGVDAPQGMVEFATKHESVIRAIGIVFKYMMFIACAASVVRQMITQGGSNPLYVMARGSAAMMGCAVGGYIGARGIAMGGALGNLLNRIGDVFSIALTINSWVP
jgi:hypothetical protein